MVTVIVCVLAGLGAGLGTGFAGMSAAAVIAPVLIVFLDINAYEALGIALASDVLASAVSAYTYGKNKNIDIRHSMWLFISVLTFTIIGALLAHLIGEIAMGNVSVYGSLGLGLNFLVRAFRDTKEKKPIVLTGTKKIVLPIVCGACIGLVCGFMGAGGGIMMLLLMTAVLGYELKTAVGTSVFIMTFTALFGAISHFVLVEAWPNWIVLGLCALSTMVFAYIGSRIANKSKPKTLNLTVGIVLVVLGTVLIIVNYIT